MLNVIEIIKGVVREQITNITMRLFTFRVQNNRKILLSLFHFLIIAKKTSESWNREREREIGWLEARVPMHRNRRILQFRV